MNPTDDAKAILLLTAPLLLGKGTPKAPILSDREYGQVAQGLKAAGRRPKDLLGPHAEEVIGDLGLGIDRARLDLLLGRGFQLSQALEAWASRSIWVISRADAAYPSQLEKSLRNQRPPILYGCGPIRLADAPGLAVVGSRNVDDELVQYSRDVGRLAARADVTVVSGAAKGVDEAAMRGSIDTGGTAIGAIAERLDRLVLDRTYRDALMEERLLFVSPYDPAAGFTIGHAMARNKLIYALSRAGLVVNADVGKGGTWAGAIEQMEKLKCVPVYVRTTGRPSPGLRALEERGAHGWPEPSTPDELRLLLSSAPEAKNVIGTYAESKPRTPAGGTAWATPPSPLLAHVEKVLRTRAHPRSVKEIARELDVLEAQAQRWVDRLVELGHMREIESSGRYGFVPHTPTLFDS